MFNFVQIIPLKDKKHDSALSMMIALMVCTILIVAFSALFLSNLSAQWHNSVTHIATLELPEGTSRSTISRVKNTLGNNSLVEDFKEINQDDIKSILSPWIDRALLDTNDIPLPTIYTLSLKSGSAIERDKLKFEIKAIDQDIKLSTHTNWLQKAFERATRLKLLAWGVGLVLSLTLITSISLLTRTRIHLNTDAIRLLHTSGATDNYIIKQFIIYISSLSIKGILAGSIAACILFLALTYSGHDEDMQNFTFNTLTKGDILFLILTPVFIFTFIVGTTSYTVSNTLKRMI